MTTKTTTEPRPSRSAFDAPTMQIAVTINGEIRQWVIRPGDILLDVLRREGYFGVKRGCETGECGACTVLLDGRPANSCMIFAAQVDGRDILTIEGLAQSVGTVSESEPTGNLEQLHRLQEAFLDAGAVQCGFCTGGMLLAAKALLDRNPNPAEDQVRDALAGHYCRCTGYRKPVEAVLASARGADPVEVGHE